MATKFALFPLTVSPILCTVVQHPRFFPRPVAVPTTSCRVGIVCSCLLGGGSATKSMLADAFSQDSFKWPVLSRLSERHQGARSSYPVSILNVSPADHSLSSLRMSDAFSAPSPFPVSCCLFLSSSSSCVTGMSSYIPPVLPP